MINKDFFFYKYPELETVVQSFLLNNKNEIIRGEFENNTIWIKKPRETKSNFLHKSFYALTKMKGLMPVEQKSKEQTLFYEVSKIQRLKDKGVNTPEVLACQKDFFVLENTGTTIKDYLRNKNIENTIVESTLETTLKTLTQMHNLDEYHAGPQVKNYTIKEDIVSTIDFEDSFDSSYNLEDLKFRDFFLFLVSLTELKREINYKEIIDIYKAETKNKTIDKELKHIALKINFLTKIVENSYLNKKFSQDVINNYHLFKTLQEL